MDSKHVNRNTLFVWKKQKYFAKTKKTGYRDHVAAIIEPTERGRKETPRNWNTSEQSNVSNLWNWNGLFCLNRDTNVTELVGKNAHWNETDWQCILVKEELGVLMVLYPGIRRAKSKKL